MLEPASSLHQERGNVLLAALLIFALLALTGLYTVHQATTEVRIAANSKSAVEAFYIAEAGIEESRVRLPSIWPLGRPEDESDWKKWRGYIGSLEQVQEAFADFDPESSHHIRLDSLQTALHYAAEIKDKIEAGAVVLWGDPDGTGVFQENTVWGKPVQVITSIGTVGGATSRITAEVIRKSLDYRYAVWGDAAVAINDGIRIWKGDPSSPYLAGVGSNTLIQIGGDVEIYGDVGVGKDISGIQGAYTNDGGLVHGVAPKDTGRIDPDPLGLFTPGSELHNELCARSLHNQNAAATGTNIDGEPISILNGAIDLDAGSTMTLPSGDYYLNSIALDSGASLTLDVSNGPVNIYLLGALEAREGSQIDMEPPDAEADQVAIYCSAQDGASSTSIDLQHAADFRGFIYAPRANSRAQNSGDFHGMLWSNNVLINIGGEVIYEPKIARRFIAPGYSLHSWREE